MVSRQDDRDEELGQRVARLEILTILAFLRYEGDIDKRSRSLLRRYLFHGDHRIRDKARYSDFSDLVEHLLSRADRPSAEHFETQVGRFQHAPEHARKSFAQELGERELREELRKTLLDLSRAGRPSPEHFETQAEQFQREHGELQEKLQNQVEVLSRRLDDTVATLGLLESGQKALSANTHEWLAAQSLGIDASSIPLSRFVPLRVYLSDTPGSAVEDVSRAIDDVLGAFGFELADEFPPLHGSWFKKWLARTTDVVTQPEVAKRLEKVERAVELQALGQTQANIDAKQAAAVAQLLEALKDVRNAAIQVGSILLIKLSSQTGSDIHVRTLTQTELILLEKNQKLLASPADLLARLSDICQAGVHRPSSIDIEKPNNRKRKKPVGGSGGVAHLQPLDGSPQPGGTVRGEPPEFDDSSLMSGTDKKRLPPPSEPREVS